MEIKERMMLNIKLHEIKENASFSFLKPLKYYGGDTLGSNFQKRIIFGNGRGREKVPQLISVSLCIFHQMISNVSLCFH